jgi:hypothetical protein
MFKFEQKYYKMHIYEKQSDQIDSSTIQVEIPPIYEGACMIVFCFDLTD